MDKHAHTADSPDVAIVCSLTAAISSPLLTLTLATDMQPTSRFLNAHIVIAITSMIILAHAGMMQAASNMTHAGMSLSCCATTSLTVLAQ